MNRWPEPRTAKGTRPRAWLPALVLALLCVLACADSPHALTPSRLAGQTRTSLEQGDAARHAIARLHAKDVAPVESEVASYGENGRLVLFASRFPDARAAGRTLSAMLERMAPGGTPFSPPAADSVRRGTWLTVGPGGHHAFWSTGAVVYWLQGDPSSLEAARSELP